MAQTENTYLIRCPACGTANKVPAESEGHQGTCGNCHSRLPALFTRPVALTDRNFDSFLQDYAGPVLAEFWAPW